MKVLQLAVRPAVGARLALGCASVPLTVRLGYLLSARPGQGALHLSCQGCACAKQRGRFASPFPVVETDLRLSPLKQRDVDMTVTATTDFAMTYTRGHACQILVKHQRARQSSDTAASSRVRVDSLYLWRAPAESLPRAYQELAKNACNYTL